MVNDNMARALVELEWLHFLIRTEKQRGSLVDAEAFDAKTLSLVHLISNGLDVFGRNLNYVPLTGFDTMAGSVKEQLGYLRQVEKSHADLSATFQAQAARLDLIHTAAAQFDAFLKAADNDRAKLSARAGELQDEVRDLFEELDRLHKQVMAAERSFKRAVERKGDCLTFENIVKVGALVATVVTTAGAATAAWASAGSAFAGLKQMEIASAGNLTWANIKGDYESIAKIVKPAGKDAMGLAASFRDAQDAYKSLFPDKPQLPEVLDQSEDAVRLVGAKADFDKAIEPYLKMPEARAYRALMHQYIGTAETRNNKILEHDRAVAEIIQIGARAAFERAGKQKLTATTAQNYDARLPENLEFISSGLTSLKWNLVRQLVSMEKSLQYMTGEVTEPNYADFSVAALSVTATSLLQRYAQALETFGREAELGKRFGMRLSDVLTPIDFERLLNNETVTLSISDVEDPLFKNLFNVQTTRIGFAAANGQVIPGDLSMTIQHLGRSIVRRRNGSKDSFTHVPVVTSFIQNLFGEVSSEGDLLEPVTEGRRRYVGVSPYGPWRLRLNSASDDARQALRTAVLTFNVFYRTMPITSGPAIASFSAEGAMRSPGLLAS